MSGEPGIRIACQKSWRHKPLACGRPYMNLRIEAHACERLTRIHAGQLYCVMLCSPSMRRGIRRDGCWLVICGLMMDWPRPGRFEPIIGSASLASYPRSRRLDLYLLISSRLTLSAAILAVGHPVH